MEEVFTAQFPSPPRVVRRKAGTGCALMFPRLFMLPHVIVGIVTLLAVPTRWYVYHHGAHVQAIIHKLERRTSRKGGDFYVVGWHYQFDGREYSEEYESMAESEGSHANIGDQIDGRAAAILGHAMFLRTSLDIRDDVMRLGVWSLIWNCFMLAAVYVIWVVPIRWRLLAKNGLTSSGRITGRQERKGRGSTYTLFYTFETINGHTIEARSTVSHEGYRAAFEGAPVTVIYDPRRPKRSLPYEFSDFIVSPAA